MAISSGWVVRTAMRYAMERAGEAWVRGKESCFILPAELVLEDFERVLESLRPYYPEVHLEFAENRPAISFFEPREVRASERT